MQSLIYASLLAIIDHDQGIGDVRSKFFSTPLAGYLSRPSLLQSVAISPHG